MPPRNPRGKNPDYSEETYLGTIGRMPCHVCKLRGNGITDPDSNWRLWNADMHVYRDGSGENYDEDEVFASEDDEILAKMERRRKAILWFSIGVEIREKHLVDLGGRSKTSEDVYRRVYEKVAPEGSPYQPLEILKVTDEIREDLRKRKAMKKRK